MSPNHPYDVLVDLTFSWPVLFWQLASDWALSQVTCVRGDKDLITVSFSFGGHDSLAHENCYWGMLIVCWSGKAPHFVV